MAWRNIRAHVKQVLLRIVGYGIIYDKFEQAKQTLFATLPIPSTSAPPSVSIPPVGIMDHIVKIVLEVSNAHVVAITQNAIIVAPTIDVGLVDQDEGDGGNLNTSSTESNNMITDSIANP